MSTTNQVDEEKKPEIAALTQFINITVSTQEEGEDLTFHIKKTTPMKKLMNVFCERKGVTYDAYVFTLDGKGINKEQTPEELEMEDGVEIDAFLPKNGGAGSLADALLFAEIRMSICNIN